MAPPAVPLDHVADHDEEPLAILVAQEDRAPVDPTGADVVVGTGGLNAEWSSHPAQATGATVRGSTGKVSQMCADFASPDVRGLTPIGGGSRIGAKGYPFRAGSRT